MADFAPYQDTPPETVRALSPPPRLTSPVTHRPEAARSPSPRSPTINPYSNHTNNLSSALHSPGDQPQITRDSYFSSRDVEAGQRNGFGNQSGLSGSGAGWGGGSGGGREDVNLFETRLGIRMDYEACLAYLLLPPAGAVLLLVLEFKSDYVRYVGHVLC
jgi:hypothetical protein